MQRKFSRLRGRHDAIEKWLAGLLIVSLVLSVGSHLSLANLNACLLGFACTSPLYAFVLNGMRRA